MKSLCWFDVYFFRFKSTGRFRRIVVFAFLENLNFSHVLSLFTIFEFSSYFFYFLCQLFFLAASVNSSCHNFSSKYFCSFELSCGCFVLSNAMWVVLGARSCHWVVFEKSAVLQLNELFWVIIIFLADAQDTSTIVSSALWNNTKGAIHNRRFTAQTLIKLLVANGMRHERVGSWQNSDKNFVYVIYGRPTRPPPPPSSWEKHHLFVAIMTKYAYLFCCILMGLQK